MRDLTSSSAQGFTAQTGGLDLALYHEYRGDEADPCGFNTKIQSGKAGFGLCLLRTSLKG